MSPHQSHSSSHQFSRDRPHNHLCDASSSFCPRAIITLSNDPLLVSISIPMLSLVAFGPPEQNPCRAHFAVCLLCEQISRRVFSVMISVICIFTAYVLHAQRTYSCFLETQNCGCRSIQGVNPARHNKRLQACASWSAQTVMPEVRPMNSA
jgi:hypothetical protein